MSGLGMNLGMNQTLGQFQTIGPRMIQSMEILQMPIAQLQEKLQAELQENPYLEVKERTTTPDDTAREFNPDGVLKHDEAGTLEFARMEEINRDWGDVFNEESRLSRGARDELGERRMDMLQNVPETPLTLQRHLVEQLPLLDLDGELFELAEFVISHLDDSGYLVRRDPETGKIEPIEVDELARAFAERSVTLEDIEEAIRVVQQLDPAGVGARDTKECLLLQVSDESPYAEIVKALIRDHMEDVAHNRLPAIQKRLGIDLDDLREAIDELRTLNPRPASDFTTESARYISPDVIVDRTEDGDYTVRLADDLLPSVKISKEYEPVRKDRKQPKAVREMLKSKLQKAQWLLSAIEQRKETLRQVTRQIVAHQRAFFDLGPDHIQPLKMEQIAEKVGVHVTTISRAVDEKWMESPRGIFPLKRFFGGGTKNSDGQDIAWETYKNKLLHYINAEDKAEPLSDEALVQLFAGDGLAIARRTVTKYREALKIPSSRQRRDWTAT